MAPPAKVLPDGLSVQRLLAPSVVAWVFYLIVTFSAFFPPLFLSVSSAPNVSVLGALFGALFSYMLSSLLDNSYPFPHLRILFLQLSSSPFHSSRLSRASSGNLMYLI